MAALYRDRYQAGEVLADALEHLAGSTDPLVLALPRGGVPVAAAVARRLGAPLDVFVVRKIGFPGHEELAMGAVASGGVIIRERRAGELVSPEAFDAACERALRELAGRERLYRGDRAPPRIAGRTAILVDDGLATGASMHAAIVAVRRLDPARVVVAVPIAPPDTCERLAAEVDEVVCAATPEPFRAVGLWYDDFSQTTDDEVRAILAALGPRGPEAQDAR